MSIDLNNLSLKELKDLQAQVAKAVSSFEDRKKKHALAELEEKARELGFLLAELTGIPQRHISEMENGRRPIGKEIAKRLADVLHADYRMLL